MGVEAFRTHLNSIKEQILDEEKLVTYVSVSKDFCIHVNDAKSLMTEVVDEIRQKQANVVLNVLYLLSGLTNDNKAVTYVCTESEIAEWRSKIKAVFFEHIYSINKGNASVDKVALMAITKFEDYHLCSGLIKSNVCIKRSAEEINSLKAKSSSIVAENDQKSKPVCNLKQNKEEKPKDPVINGTVAKKTPEIKCETTVKPEKVSPKKESSNNKQKHDKNGVKHQKGITGFFSRSESHSETNKTSKNHKNEEPEVKVEAMDVDKEDVTVKTEKMDVDEDFKEKKEAKNKNHGKSTQSNGTSQKNAKVDSNKSSTNIKKNAKVDKKRKRVLHVSDSDSDEERNDPFVDEPNVEKEQIDFDSEDEIPPTPTANTIKVSSALLNPKKRRKLVNKTYIDEEGYMMTRKEEVYESLSENEDSKENVETVVKKEIKETPKEESHSSNTEISPKNKKNGAKNSKKKISPPQKGKQATLMSFFKKA